MTEVQAGFHAPATKPRIDHVAHAVHTADKFGVRSSACGIKGRFLVDIFPWQCSWERAPESVKCKKCMDKFRTFADKVGSK